MLDAAVGIIDASPLRGTVPTPSHLHLGAAADISAVLKFRLLQYSGVLLVVRPGSTCCGGARIGVVTTRSEYLNCTCNLHFETFGAQFALCFLGGGSAEAEGLTLLLLPIDRRTLSPSNQSKQLLRKYTDDKATVKGDVFARGGLADFDFHDFALRCL